MKKTEYPEKSFHDTEFLESLEGRTLRILSEYLGEPTTGWIAGSTSTGRPGRPITAPAHAFVRP